MRVIDVNFHLWTIFDSVLLELNWETDALMKGGVQIVVFVSFLL